MGHVATIIIPTYRQCLGIAWDGSGQCRECGREIGTGGTCLALIPIDPTLPASTQEEK